MPTAARAIDMAAFNSIAVIGAGAWGTALAAVAARAGRSVTLYARSSASVTRMKATHENPRLPGIRLESSIDFTGDIAQAANADAILIVTPAQNLRGAVIALAPYLKQPKPVIACAKGIERGTHKFMTEVIAEAAPAAIPAILSGPSFADDVVAAKAETTLIIPPPALCTDNGAMIAWAGAERMALGLTDSMEAPPRARWLLDANAKAPAGYANSRAGY